MNHLTMTIGAEEDKVTAIAIRPGMVDTEMQREIREDHRENLDQDVYSRFSDAHKEGKLVKPEGPAQVMAELALRAPLSLSGKFIQ
jgi:NAD(P)-dependent dehydrogenase (short-subunit alcohol dehydrogenase family)